MRFWKMNGCGNAFAIIDGRETPLHPSTAKIREIARTMQADQVIVMERAVKPRSAYMRIWNADGSEVAACGNASRCVAHILMEEEGTDQVLLQTRADILKARRADGGMVTVDMGVPMQKWADIPLAREMDTRALDLVVDSYGAPSLPRPAAVSMGNPHCVFFVQDIDAYDVARIGAEVEHLPLFPERVNVGFAEVRNWRLIRLKVWERGAGLTLACGTGACAALVCAARAGMTDRRARVIVDGGELHIHWREEDDRVYMTGPVELEMDSEAVV